MNTMEWLINWYKSNCNGYWEHCYGIKIKNSDNPGWILDIDLQDTLLENKDFTKIQIDNGDQDWFFCEVKDKVFRGRGDADKLITLLNIFKSWAESQPSYLFIC